MSNQKSKSRTFVDPAIVAASVFLEDGVGRSNQDIRETVGVLDDLNFTQADLEKRLTLQIAICDRLLAHCSAQALHGLVKVPLSLQAMEVGLRAAEQARRAIATLDSLRNPKRPTQFIKQYVDKQLNELRVEQSAPGAGATVETDKQLEASTSAQMDFGGERATAAIDPGLEAVAVEHRPAHRPRKSRKQQKCQA
jgi:hypothetical protein